MNFLEYVVMFNKIKRDNDILFMVSEDNYCEYKIGDIILTNCFNGDFNLGNIFVIIDNNNIGIPIDYLYIDKSKNMDFVYQIDDKKVIKKIGRINSCVISDYKKKYILSNKNVL